MSAQKIRADRKSQDMFAAEFAPLFWNSCKYRIIQDGINNADLLQIPCLKEMVCSPEDSHDSQLC
jgi:hypothetical protein